MSSDAKYETTAAFAEAETSTIDLAQKVAQNAELEKKAAQEAALAAQTTLNPEVKGGASGAASQMSATTDKAVAEGQHDVQSAKATGAGYLDQAKALAGAAVSTAQSYMPSTAQANGTANGLVGSLQSAATTALATGKQYFQTVSATAQPHVDAAKAAAQPHIDKALETASGYVGAAQSKVGSATSTDTGIPSTSAPLESGPHTVGTPYPSTTTTQGSDELAKGPSTLSVGENSA